MFKMQLLIMGIRVPLHVDNLTFVGLITTDFGIQAKFCFEITLACAPVSSTRSCCYTIICLKWNIPIWIVLFINYIYINITRDIETMNVIDVLSVLWIVIITFALNWNVSFVSDLSIINKNSVARIIWKMFCRRIWVICIFKIYITAIALIWILNIDSPNKKIFSHWGNHLGQYYHCILGLMNECLSF